MTARALLTRPRCTLYTPRWTSTPRSATAHHLVLNSPLRIGLPWQIRPVRLKLAATQSYSTASSPLSPPPSIPGLPLPRFLSPSRALLLLRLPIPPSSWPSHLNLSSPLLLRLTTALKPHGISVNAVYDGIGTSTSFYPPKGQEEGYPADLYWPDGVRRRYDRLTSKDVGEGGRLLEDVKREVEEARLAVGGESGTKGVKAGGDGEMEILVCTHGSRDCRCENIGGALVRALREEIAQRGANVKVGEIAHVGGHKYAANAVLLPSLDLLSNLSPTHAPSLLTHILANRPPDSPAWAHWRGRYGLTETEQQGVWNGTAAAHAEERLAENRGGVGREAGRPMDEARKWRLKFRTYEGEVREVEGREGETLLQVAKKGDLPAMEGTCGGNLECATCHLYISSTAPVPPESEGELDMLGYALGYRDGESRLGCQVKVTEALGRWASEGGVLQLPRF